MGKFLAVLIGLVAMVGGILLVVFVWWREFYELVFGCIPPLLFFGGLIALIAGISSILSAVHSWWSRRKKKRLRGRRTRRKNSPLFVQSNRTQ